MFCLHISARCAAFPRDFSLSLPLFFISLTLAENDYVPDLLGDLNVTHSFFEPVAGLLRQFAVKW